LIFNCNSIDLNEQNIQPCRWYSMNNSSTLLHIQIWD
jgi:hypothetical protein